MAQLMDLSPVYTPEETEKRWYKVWEEKGYFKPSSAPQPETPSFSVVIPPPNVTGSLHMGHALNNTLQDILVRWHRMQGRRTLWVPGTDHGGIATQNVVEKLIRNEKKTRQDLGREKFLERMWQWRRESGDTILMQLRRLGASCDWTRARFTMDDGYSYSVRSAFVQLFEKGLIYRGPRMVNWCPRCQTALADIEVEHEERSGKLWYIRYPVTEGSRLQAPGSTELQAQGSRLKAPGNDQSLEPGASSLEPTYVVVATTRPETMLGDTAVAVNPTDERYKGFIGKMVRLPLVDRLIPIIGDVAIDASFGTGAVKVTPAHDMTDFEIGERHHLPHEVIIDFQGKMTDRAKAYAGLDRFEARKRVIADLESQGLLEKVEDYRLSAATCYRCQTVIEPLVSEQWFLKMTEMAAQAARATREGRVKIIPSSWEKPYLSWLDTIRDWCISRQIWWGHRIPVYYCPNSRSKLQAEHRSRLQAQDSAGSTFAPAQPGASSLDPSTCSPIAAVEKPNPCPTCGSRDLTHDEDVLDTWFSSALWPFAVFGWPEQTEDLKTFYPTSVLVTGHEILYLWVARMVMMGLEFQKNIPFREVFIHGIVRDKQGKKMSKSLGNVIDPLDIMKQYGTDALRLSLAMSSIPGRDMQLSNDSFLAARNFANKLWNASRFVLMNLADYSPQPLPSPEERTLADRWILHELVKTIQMTSEAFSHYNLAEASRVLYEFLWNSFCDWYIEIAKISLTGPDRKAKQRTQTILFYVLERALSLLHPVMPYETEELFQGLRARIPSLVESIMIQAWPSADASLLDKSSEVRMSYFQRIVTSIRTIRSEMNILPGKKIACLLKTPIDSPLAILLREMESAFFFLTRADKMDIDESISRPPESAVAVVDGGEIYLPLHGLIDLHKEKQRLEKNLQQLLASISRDKSIFENQDFRKRAPEEEVQRVRERLEQTETKVSLLQRNLEGL